MFAIKTSPIMKENLRRLLKMTNESNSKLNDAGGALIIFGMVIGGLMINEYHRHQNAIGSILAKVVCKDNADLRKENTDLKNKLKEEA